jgi:hypothetical protein
MASSPPRATSGQDVDRSNLATVGVSWTPVFGETAGASGIGVAPAGVISFDVQEPLRFAPRLKRSQMMMNVLPSLPREAESSGVL